MGSILGWLHGVGVLAQQAQENAPRNPALIADIKTYAAYLASAVAACAALIIGIAAIEVILNALLLFFRRTRLPDAKEDIRLRLERWLAVALEFGPAAPIVRPPSPRPGARSDNSSPSPFCVQH